MSISTVVNSGACMSCGACSSICNNAIRMTFITTEGFYRPIVDDALCSKCQLCEKVCPALHQKNESLVGQYKSISLWHSNNDSVRNGATSGGMINSLVRYIIDYNVVDAVLLVIHDNNSPIEASSIVVTKQNVSLLQDNPREFASRYVVVPLLEHFRDISAKYKKIAIVGTSCQINAVDKLASLLHREVLKIGITCSGGMSYLATQEYKRKMQMDDSAMYYRGDGWPGKNLLVKNDKRVEYRHTGSMYERMFSSQIFKNSGCRLCKDHFAEAADISFCDFWNSKEMASEPIGNSVVIVRSQFAAELLKQMEECSYSDMVRELDYKELIGCQKQVLNAKKGEVKHSYRLKAFYLLCDVLRKSRFYKLLGIREYRKLGHIYSKIVNEAEIGINRE